jgi:hypothetical protein
MHQEQILTHIPAIIAHANVINNIKTQNLVSNFQYFLPLTFSLHIQDGFEYEHNVN